MTWTRDEKDRRTMHWRGEGFAITLTRKPRFVHAQIREGATIVESSDSDAIYALRRLREAARDHGGLSDAAWIATYDALIVAARTQ